MSTTDLAVTEQKLSKTDETYSPTVAGQIAQAEAWLKAACIMAERKPRDMDRVRQNILKECERPSFAATARYAKPIGNTKVMGFSVRFAEAMIAAMGHIHVSMTTLAESDEWRKIEVRVWDAEKMVSYADEVTVAKTIERRVLAKGQEFLRTRANRQGDVLYIIRAEEGDLLNTVNAAKSKSLRNSGLRCVPGWLLDECEKAIIETVRKTDAVDPDTAKRRMIDAYGELGVTVDQLKDYVGHSLETLQPAEIQELRALYTAIKDGEVTIQKAFAKKDENGEPAKDMGKGIDALKKKLDEKADRHLNQDEVDNLSALASENKWPPLEYLGMLSKEFKAEAPSKLRVSQLAAVIDRLRRR